MPTNTGTFPLHVAISVLHTNKSPPTPEPTFSAHLELDQDPR